MSNTKTINNASTSSLYKLQDNSTPFISNSFPIRRLVRPGDDQAWINAYRSENKKYFEAILTNQKLSELENEKLADKEKKKPTTLSVSKKQTLEKFKFSESSESSRDPKLVDGFFLLQTFCVEDPVDLTTIDISYKGLNQIKEEDMALFENICEINANENLFNFESFKCFQSLKCLYVACNNIKSIRLKHDDFVNLDSLDLSFNSLTPTDVVHLGVLRNLKFLKLTGNNLSFLPETFSKQYVYTKENKKVVTEKFPNLEELYLDHNKLKAEESFDVLSVLKKLKKLYLNSNNICCIPNLKIFRKNHVYQEFNKSYFKRKNKNREKQRSASGRKSIDLKQNESMVKDLERPSSEMNMHNSSLLRNSFILEENEEDVQQVETLSNSNDLTLIDENKRLTTSSSLDNFEKAFDLPFPELVYINLADNQIEEEDDLIAISSWPMLNEIILYGNPIVYNNVGYPPLIKKYLVERLGISVHRQRPLRPLRAQPTVIPQRESRLVDSQVPKIPKMPVDMRMIAYYHEALENNVDDERAASDRSNLSSAESVSMRLNKKTGSTPESMDTVGHHASKNSNSDHLFKPFKKEKASSHTGKDDLVMESTDMDETDRDADERSGETAKMSNENKDYNSFFMTQIDQEETAQQTTTRKDKTAADVSSKLAPRSDSAVLQEKFQFLFNIENEEQIKVPKGIGANVRALKHMLDHPLVLREPENQLDKPQAPYRTINKEKRERPADPRSTAIAQPRVARVNEILDNIKDRKAVEEVNLAQALGPTATRRERKEATVLLDKAQKAYDQVRKETIKQIKLASVPLPVTQLDQQNN